MLLTTRVGAVEMLEHRVEQGKPDVEPVRLIVRMHLPPVNRCGAANVRLVANFRMVAELPGGAIRLLCVGATPAVVRAHLRGNWDLVPEEAAWVILQRWVGRRDRGRWVEVGRRPVRRRW